MKDRIMLWGDALPDVRFFEDRIDRVFERALGRDRQTPWMPAMDVYETDDKLVVTLELPGLSASDVDVRVEDSTLTINGKREFSNEVNEDHYQRIERRYGQFSRAVTCRRWSTRARSTRGSQTACSPSRYRRTRRPSRKGSR